MEDNKTFVMKFFSEVINSQDINVLDNLVHPEYVNYGFPMDVKGPEALKQITGMMWSGFPDLKIKLEGIIAEGNTVAARGYWEATHNGEFMGVPASGKRVKVGFIDMWNIEDGKLRENWVQMDFTGLMQQIQ